MSAPEACTDQKGLRISPPRSGELVRRAFAEFLKVPTLIIAGFLLLAACTSVLDYAQVGWLTPLRAVMRENFFRDGKSTSDLLATIAGSIITVTSITFSLLLLAVQQAAGALTAQVYDQFLRRRVNQVYFGFFVGLALFTLVVLATVNPAFNPVFGAAIALLLTIVALTLIILLLYTTIDQMRPSVVISSIHDYTLMARECQQAWISKTRSSPQASSAAITPVYSARYGYVVRVDVSAIGAAAAETASEESGEVEVVLQVSIGAFVAFQDTLAEIRGATPGGAAKLAPIVEAAIAIEAQRDVDQDAAYGVEQLAMIGWTSVSTAKSNPAPGLLVLHSLRDLLARWSVEWTPQASGAAAGAKLPVVYFDDVLEKLMDAFETLAVVASESMQPQTMAELVRTFALMLPRLPAAQQIRAEDLLRRSLSALGEHVLTAELEAALSDLIRALQAVGRPATAAQIQTAHSGLRASVGRLGSRATRATASD